MHYGMCSNYHDKYIKTFFHFKLTEMLPGGAVGKWAWPQFSSLITGEFKETRPH